MKIILENKEVLDMVHSALCNGGLNELRKCDVDFNVSLEDYEEAKNTWNAENDNDPCREDVWVQILKSKKALVFFDNNNGEEKNITIESAKEALSNESAFDVIIAYKNEQDDALTASELLQHCLYGEVIFG